MSFSWKGLFALFIMVVLVMAFYNLVIKVYVLPKIKINKWIVLALGVVAFFMTNFVSVSFKINPNEFDVKVIPYYLCMALVLLFFLAFFDLSGWGASGRVDKKNGKKDIVIKPKAKPNRVKNKKKE